MVQKMAYRDGAQHFSGKSDFVAFIDVDEFIFCEDGSSLPAALLQYASTTGAMGLNQRVFGSSGRIHPTPGFVTARFIYRAASDCSEHLYFKTIARPELIDRFDSVHSVVLSDGAYIFSDGSALVAGMEHPGKADKIRFGNIRLNHYPLKSLEEFRLKQARFSRTDLINNYNDAYFLNRAEVANVTEDRMAANLEEQIAQTINELNQFSTELAISVDTSHNQAPCRNLIYDLGMSEGNDTQYYLAKGFDVVGIEADPIVFENLKVRFSDAISSGRLSIYNRAATATSGFSVTFYHNDREQGHSSLDPIHSSGEKKLFDVTSINWKGLKAIRGVPYYLKIDIQRGEKAFLDSMQGEPTLPVYVSAECHTFNVVEQLYALGYRKFKLVNQTSLSSFPRPDPALEGIFVLIPDWHHASGPFGRELPGQWSDFAGVAVLFDLVMRIRDCPSVMAPTWFDCHATNV